MKGDLAAISRALKCIGNCAFPGAMSGPVANTMQVLGSVEQELQKQVAMREQGATQKSASPAASPQSPGASGAAAPAQAGR
jgi:hypothetical protein